MATDKDRADERQPRAVNPNALTPAPVAPAEQPDTRADETIDGGRYINANGHYVNASGQYITFDGKIVDEPVKARK